MGHIFRREFRRRRAMESPSHKMQAVVRQHQNSHRFSWRDLRTHWALVVYSMTRVTFGHALYPSFPLHCYSTKAWEKKHEKDHPTAAREVIENMYVDDVFTGALEDDSAVKLRNELCNLFSKGGFQMKKWAYDKKVTMETKPLRDRAPTLVLPTELEKMSDSFKALGT